MAASHENTIREHAHELGFDVVGFASAEAGVEEDHARYLRFVDAGMAGDMGYLTENAAIRARLDGDGILPGARTVVCLARRYDRREQEPGLVPLLARYARGRDYHGFLKKQLRKLAKVIAGLAPGVQARALCDTAPVLERAWAARAGLGFVGKNGLLIVPGQGSFCLLGEVVTTLALEAFGVPMGERCGSCRACLEACPTQAFDAPFVLDPRRCVSYATIEQRSPPAPASWESIGDHLFGCDVCQSVCPYNHVAPADPAQTAPFAAFERWAQLPLVALSSCDEAAWRALTEGSPLRRATRVGMAHNALLVAARRLTRDAGDEDARRALEAGIEHDDASVRRLAAALVADD